MTDLRIPGNLLLVGCGKMGAALLGGWLDRGAEAAAIAAIEPQSANLARFRDAGVNVAADAESLGPGAAPAVVVFAVKPQQLEPILPAYARFARHGTVFLSIAAGKTIAYYQGHLGAAAAIVRAMPNTPAAVGRGMTVLCPNPVASGPQRATCEALMSAVGGTAWIEDESLLDPVTAVSGGGPAYVFLLIECLARAGVEAGLPEALAMRIARATVAGSGELVRGSEESAASLRENVTSPGGTTQAALRVLMAPDGLEPLMIRAIAEATRRGRELAS